MQRSVARYVLMPVVLCLGVAAPGTGVSSAHRPASVKDLAGDAHAAPASGAALVRTIPVPAHSVALAVDAPAGRVVVLAQGPGDLQNSDQPTGHASVSFLDAATSRLIHTTMLGHSSYVGVTTSTPSSWSDPHSCYN